MIFIYTVFPTQEEAKKVAQLLLREKMVACANMWSINSLYFWDQEIKEGKEVAVIFKTLRQNYSRVCKEITRHHSYEVPFIGMIKVNSINGPFYQYLKKNVVKYYGKKSPEAKPNLPKSPLN
jgi:periplasmic divalent cation tolerance protein